MGACHSATTTEDGVPHVFFDAGASRAHAAWAADFARTLRIRKGDLDRLYSVFVAMDVKRRGAVELPAFYRYLDVAPSAYADRVFALFDEGGDGIVDFHDFVVSCWHYCALDASALLRFAFMLYDTAATGFLSGEQLHDMVRQMFGDRYQRNRRVMGIFAEAGFADKLSFETFAGVARAYPYLLFPAFAMQQQVRARVLGEAFWQGHFDERARRGNEATYSVWTVLEAMRAARVRADGGEMAVALQGRYVPAHLAGSAAAAAAATIAEDPVRKGQARRAALGLPPAAGDADDALLHASSSSSSSSSAAPHARGRGAAASADEAEGLEGDPTAGTTSGASSAEPRAVHGASAGAGDPLAQVRTLGGRARALPALAGGPAGRRGSRVANAAERAALMALGR